MTSKKLLSQSQIIKEINSQTRKGYKLFDKLLSLRAPVSQNRFSSNCDVRQRRLRGRGENLNNSRQY